MPAHLKTPLTVRGDSLYCPLSFSLDSYGNCLTDCWHCYFRNLNKVWGEDLKPINPEDLRRKLVNGLSNKSPKTAVAWAIAQKKTLRFGNKADPFQEAELTHRVSGEALRILQDLKWPTVIQTRFTQTLLDNYEEIIGDMEAIVMPVISPGFEKDWEILERERTTHPEDRLNHLSYLQGAGVNVGVNGEPFIPGYHTVEQFEETLKRLVDYGINRYNTYNFHFNPFVAKRLHAIGIDIEAIWYYNQDIQWKPILQKLLDLGKRYNIIIGCPDFVNSGVKYIQGCNTCCGVDVPNPTTFNTHTWIRLLQEGKDPEAILKETWDGIGDFEQGREVLTKTHSKFYTIKKQGLLI